MINRLLLLLAILLIAFTASVLWMTKGEPPHAHAAAPQHTADAGVGGPFMLIDQNGKPVTDASFRGKFMLVYFGFTHCPDLCPTTLATMTQALKLLGDKAAGVAPIFITVDPGRDDPSRMKEYLANFSPTFTGLTGSEAQIATAAKAYRVYYAPHMDPEEAENHEAASGQVDHSGIVYLMGRDGAYLTHFSPSDNAETMADALRSYLK